jgi:hypothetical protein
LHHYFHASVVEAPGQDINHNFFGNINARVVEFVSGIRLVCVACNFFEDLFDEVEELLRVNVVLKSHTGVVFKDFLVNVTWFLVFSTFPIANKFVKLFRLFILVNIHALCFDIFDLSLWNEDLKRFLLSAFIEQHITRLAVGSTSKAPCRGLACCLFFTKAFFFKFGVSEVRNARVIELHPGIFLSFNPVGVVFTFISGSVRVDVGPIMASICRARVNVNSN